MSLTTWQTILALLKKSIDSSPLEPSRCAIWISHNYETETPPSNFYMVMGKDILCWGTSEAIASVIEDPRVKKIYKLWLVPNRSGEKECLSTL